MIYTSLTKRAMRVAYDAHHGQVDKAGTPYVFHPIHLAEQMEDEVSTCVALLHDVVEDGPVTMEELERTFPSAVTRPLRLLTHEEGTGYLAYICEIAKDPIARAVKLADLAHNADETRLEDVGPDALRRREKYAKARAILEEAGRCASQETDGSRSERSDAS